MGVGLAPEAVCHALERTRGVPGRLERIDGGPDAPTVLVDYAHTPDALARVTRTLRPLANAGGGQLVVVFGCGGGRDRGKRAPMARAVEETAHLAIVTSDNPRDEPPQAILAEVLAGFRRPAGVRAIEDRRAAIRAAIAAAGPRDVVLLAGKGHETTQVIAGVATPFDDREVARAELRRAA